jgi:fructokinase
LSASQPLFGGIELGGTKVICAVGTGPAGVIASDRNPTKAPEQTLGWVVRTLKRLEKEHGHLEAIGIAAFGPIDLRGDGPDYGRLLNTPKPGWSAVSVLEPIRSAFALPIEIASDVEGAALAESLTGAGKGADPLVYVTVGTGIGAGAITGGEPLRGLVHPEVGHIAVPRVPGDDFAGACPFHGDCLEGMASGPAMAARWGRPAEELAGAVRDRAMALEAAYLAAGLRSIVLSYAPQRIVLGGGLGLTPGLIDQVRDRLIESLGGYPGLAEYERADLVALAKLGAMAGPAGERALRASAAGKES